MSKFKVGDKVIDIYKPSNYNNIEFGKIGTLILIDKEDIKHVKYDDKVVRYSYDTSLKLVNSIMIREKLGVK